jgi:hypothetical protein
MASSSKPSKVVIRSYQVGFGDCFLLIFDYGKEERFLLVDFGTNGTPKGNNKQQMLQIAKDIHERCKGKLHVVVATHRHKDHISGFSTEGKESSGKIIRSCKPDLVIQPWTEAPEAKVDAQEAPDTATMHFRNSLEAMNAFAGKAFHESGRFWRFDAPMLGDLAFAGQNNLPNSSAVENLMTMGKKRLYVNAGYSLDWSAVLPGVKVWVLGPPTLKQSQKIKTEARDNPAEFWLTQSNFWQLEAKGMATAPGGKPLFELASDNKIYPLATRWFAKRAAAVRTDQLLGLVRILDKAMNNTSVILLLEVAGKRILLPGDAQIENWSYALGQQKYKDLLRTTDLYKVGHHGSRNATPKTLWNLFDKRGAKGKAGRLKSMVSTMAGKYGASPETQVPRKTLVRELKARSDFFSTEELGATLYKEETVPE